MEVKRIKSIDRAVKVLKVFNESNPELKLSEISEKLNINKSTLHGILATLKLNGLIDQDPETQKYRLGLGLLALGSTVKNSLGINEIALPHIEYLQRLLEETVHLGVLEDAEVIYLVKSESNQSVRIVTNVGARNPAYCTGVGKTLLAYQDEAYLMNLLPEKFEKKTDYTIATRAELFKEFEEIRENGYGMDNQEFNLGLTCVAAPVFDSTNKVVYAISISGASFRMTEEKIAKAIKLIKEETLNLSKKLGYNPNY